MKIAVYVPCYVDQMAPQIGVATVRILRRLGHEVLFPKDQTCCGQPAFNTGYWDEAAECAERQTKIFLETGADAVVCPSGSCGAMQKVFFPELLEGTQMEKDAVELASKTFELCQFLVNELNVTDLKARFNAKAVLHKSCHGMREMGIRDEPRTLLDNVEGLEMLPLEGDEECCGFGGTFSAKVGDVSTAMGDVKLDNVLKSGADWIISYDYSCLMHLNGRVEKRKLPIKSIHIAEVLESRH